MVMILSGGKYNEKDGKINCKGVDNRMKKYLMVIKNEASSAQPENPNIHRDCVEQCSSRGLKTFLNRCVQDNRELESQKLISRTGFVNFFQDVSEDLSSCFREIIYVCIISFVFSFIVLVMFRFVVGFVVWIVLVASVITGFVATIYLWIKYAQKKRDSQDYERVTTYLIAAIIVTLVTIVISLVIFGMRKRVKLVIQLFREAGKALTDMPLLLIEPLLVRIEK
jgi:solute carrier family 44 (choline transporter-like protein), member 1